MRRGRATSLTAVREYYDTRAPEYDEWSLGLGRFAHVDRQDWDENLGELELTIARLPLV